MSANFKVAGIWRVLPPSSVNGELPNIWPRACSGDCIVNSPSENRDARLNLKAHIHHSLPISYICQQSHCPRTVAPGGMVARGWARPGSAIGALRRKYRADQHETACSCTLLAVFYASYIS